MSADRSDKPPPPFIPVHAPGIFHCSPAESFDTQFDWRSNGPREWSHLETLGDFHAILRDGFPIDFRNDIVNTAIVFGNRKGRVQPAASVHRKFPKGHC